LGDIESKSTYGQIFYLACLNDIGKSDTRINSRFEFETTKLTRVDEVIHYYIELKSFSNNFLDELAHSVEKNN